MRKWYTTGKKEILLKNSLPIPIGYVEGRLERPSRLSELTKQISKESLYEHYIIENTSFEVLFKQLGISRNELRRLLTKYGIKKSGKLASKNNTFELIKKQHQTREKRRLERGKMLCRTLAEQNLYTFLAREFDDVQYDVRVDDRYPYYCDFYIPSKDLFIELQAHPSHGRLPISLMSIDEYSKYPNKWVDVFARRDVEKLQYIKKNKLNFIRLYPKATLHENYLINGFSNKRIIDICYKSQHIKSHYGNNEP